MKKRLKNVAEVINNLSDDKEFAKKAVAEINKSELSNLLFSLRCKKGLNQKEIAKKMGCSQSKISKIESSYDMDLFIGDIVLYSDALGLNFNVGLSEPMKKVDLVKYHAIQMKMHLDDLVEMAKTDDDITHGVGSFCEEALDNTVRFITSSFEKLNISKKKAPCKPFNVLPSIKL